MCQCLYLCLCVLADRYMSQSEYTEAFLGKLGGLYPRPLGDLRGVEEENLTLLFNRLLHSFVFWNASRYSRGALAADCGALLSNHT